METNRRIADASVFVKNLASQIKNYWGFEREKAKRSGMRSKIRHKPVKAGD
jgi:hypothetical protein